MRLSMQNSWKRVVSSSLTINVVLILMVYMLTPLALQEYKDRVVDEYMVENGITLVDLRNYLAIQDLCKDEPACQTKVTSSGGMPKT